VSRDLFADYRRQRRAQLAHTWWTKENAVLAVLTLAVGVVWWFAAPRYFPRLADAPPAPVAVSVPTDTAHAPGAPYRPPARLTVVFFDVGQGDACAFFTPAGKIFLIDGGEGRADNRDNSYVRAVNAGRRIILPYLARRNARELTAAFLTHPHSDHYGGLIDVLQGVRVRAFYNSGQPAGSFGYKNLLQVLARRQTAYVEPVPGEELALDERLKLTVLAVNSDADNLNNASLVLRARYGGVSFLLMGDAETAVEKELLAERGGQLRSTVLKVGHHGSRTSSSFPFVTAVRPRFAVVSVGSYNGFGHPDGDVLRRLRVAGADVLRTDQRGTITMTTGGNINDLRVTGEKERGAAGELSSAERSDAG